MNLREYEEYQLKLIGQSYRERGFNVEYEPVIKGLSYRFDAIARNDSGEIIIIELVNKHHRDKAMHNKLKALEEVSNLLPRAKVDFRYLDLDAGVLQIARPRPPEVDKPDLKKILAKRLPRINTESVDATRPFLELWVQHVAAIRAYGVNLGWNEAETESMLDLYNKMLRSQSLVAPEGVVDDVRQDLFDLFAEAQGVIQGASIDRDKFLQLRGHVVEVRRQIRRYLAQ